MATEPVIPANRRRAEAALCRVAKAEAGIQKTTWIPGQARNDNLDDTVGVASSHDPHPYGYLVSNCKNNGANLEPFPVIPAKAGIQYFQQVLDPAAVFTGVTRRDDGVRKYR